MATLQRREYDRMDDTEKRGEVVQGRASGGHCRGKLDCCALFPVSCSFMTSGL